MSTTRWGENTLFNSGGLEGGREEEDQDEMCLFQMSFVHHEAPFVCYAAYSVKKR